MTLLSRGTPGLYRSPTWEFVVEPPGPPRLFVNCPDCSTILEIDGSYQSDRGVLDPCLVCECGYHEFVRLQGWTYSDDVAWQKAARYDQLRLRLRLRKIELGLEEGWRAIYDPYSPSASLRPVFTRWSGGNTDAIELTAGGTHYRSVCLDKRWLKSRLFPLSVRSVALDFYNPLREQAGLPPIVRSEVKLP